MTNAIKSQRKYNRDVYSYCGNGEQLRSQSIPRLSGILNACGSTSGAIVDITAHARKRRSAGASCKQKKRGARRLLFGYFSMGRLPRYAQRKLAHAVLIKWVSVPTLLRLNHVPCAYIRSSEAEAQDVEVLVIKNVVELST